MSFKVNEIVLFVTGFKSSGKYSTLHDIIFKNQLV
jgi:hypothetical protein